MTALDAFTFYLAQAHGCRTVAAVPAPARAPAAPLVVPVEAPAAPPAWSVWAAGRDPGAAHAPPPASELPHTLLVSRVPSVGTPRAVERLARVRRMLELAPAALVLLEGPASPRLEEERRALEDRGLAPAFLGRVEAADGAPADGTLAVVDDLARSGSRPAVGAAPEQFRVVAVVPTYDEEDVIAQTLHDLIRQGVDVFLIDNWSTDATVERARPFLGRGLVAIERFPPDGPPPTYDLGALLGHVESVAERLTWASWVVLHDADERRRSPWPGVGLRDALWYVDRCGYSCVDHVTLEFRPTDDGFDPDGPDLEEYFRHFEFSAHPGHFHQRRAWKQPGRPVGLRRSAGHDVDLPGRRVYPYKFLLKHYPIRSAAHADRKLRDRLRRWNARERAAGWHRQYDGLTPERAIRDPATLRPFDPATFDERYLIERLSAAGVFSEPPPWATPPRW